ncbi:protogloblin ApPgb [Spongiactinospora rosea]|uniref:Protogloblin ApPgb n=1 Tax=Spongiactinospora rosea TaxID=2248750 RepID=A0A366M5I3_9ACTN|nr:protoglobin domain-containing protein [Spongiactinospora rosea]RBQ20990.1 protogloblin ApPgb [Spongiactinospora rosea]
MSVIDGYTYGQNATSPVTLDDLSDLRASVLFGPDDEEALRLAGDVLESQVEDVLDVWYGFVGANPHLLASFSTPEGQPVEQYLARVRVRFGQWILDTCRRPYDQSWLDYQHEIGLRHTSAKKNHTDSANAPSYVALRHVIALIYPITATIRPFLERKGHSAEQVEAMFQAWFKAVVLQVALWARAYGDGKEW